MLHGPERGAAGPLRGSRAQQETPSVEVLSRLRTHFAGNRCAREPWSGVAPPPPAPRPVNNVSRSHS